MDDAGDRHNVTLSGRWFLFAIAPVIPFLLGTVVMQLVATVDTEMLVQWFVPAEGADIGHLGDRLAYGTAAFLQLIVCAGAVVLFWTLIHRHGTAGRRAAYRVILTILALGGVIVALLWTTKAAPYELTLNLVRGLLEKGPSTSQEFAMEGFFLGQSRTFWAALVPFAIGVTAVAVSSGFGAAISTAADDETELSDWEAAFAHRMGQLQNGFRVASVVLVVTTVSLMLFLQLPAGIAADSGRALLSRFALGMTMFWGTVMTATLFAIFVPPFLALRREAAARHSSTNGKQPFDEWLAERQGFSVKLHITNLGTMLAPIMVGPIGSILQSGFGG